MRLRAAPEPFRFQLDPLWERTKQFKQLVQMLLADPNASLPATLTRNQFVLVEAAYVRARWPHLCLTQRDFGLAMERAINETKLVLAAPERDTPTEDLIAVWSQPEAREFLERVMVSAGPTRISAPGLHFALLVMLVLSSLRATTHIRAAYNIVVHNEALRRFASAFALSCQGVLRCEPAPVSYEQVTRLMPRLSAALSAEAHVALTEIASALISYGYPVGRYLACDGTQVPAWAQQRSSRTNGKDNPAREAFLRRRTPEAGFRVYKRTLASGESVVTSAVRGYTLTCLVDLATGLCLGLDLRDASTAHEPRVLRDILLPRLFELLPNLDVDAIVADSKYDDDPTHERLETHYGIHLVAVKKKHALTTRAARFDVVDHPSVAAVRGDGIAICRAHGLELVYKELVPNRKLLGLAAGEPLDPRKFRSRFECPIGPPAGCGKVSIPTRACWSLVPFYPPTPHGRYKLYAYRRALLARRNQIEAFFSGQQVSNKQGTDGPDRLRPYDHKVTESLAALAALDKGLSLLFAARAIRGEAQLP